MKPVTSAFVRPVAPPHCSLPYQFTERRLGDVTAPLVFVGGLVRAWDPTGWTEDSAP
jgi:hypothetical protein